MVRAVGWWGVPLTTGWIGVPIHELSHVLAAWSLGRKVDKVTWFAPDAETGTLGAVQWQPGQGWIAWLAVTWVGIAPLFGGALCLQGLLLAAEHATGVQLPPTVFRASGHLEQDVVSLAAWAMQAAKVAWHAQGWARMAGVVGAWSLVAVASHMLPSRSDLQGVWRGALLLLVVAAAAGAALHAGGVAWRQPVLALAYGLCGWLRPGLLLALPATLASGVLAWSVARLRGRS